MLSGTNRRTRRNTVIWWSPLCVAALLVTVMLSCLSPAAAEDVSSPALLQMFEARWDTIEDRLVDVFAAGYGGMWLPPPARADSGGLSVGYDVFDRFDLGRWRNETLYGTERHFRQLVQVGHQAGVNSYTDLILNHNGFSDINRPGFEAEGDYPGFVLSLPNDPNGDFHPKLLDCGVNEETCRLAGLIDIDQSKNYQFIRHPVEAGNPLNIPSGSIWDIPDPANARFYQDRDLGGTQVFNPGTNSMATLYDFNTADPLQGDAVTDNATGLLMRNMRWMVQELGVDGFRFDAARHMPRWFLNFADEAVFLAKKQPLLDGSVDHVFSFLETGYDSPANLQTYIRKDIDPNNLSEIRGNRDALDFNLFGAIRGNLTANGLANDWRNVKNASIDGNDDGLANNGSQGVAFARSHDELGAYLDEVAHAYILMRPGNALVYLNAGEFGPTSVRDFPRGGRDDALGGFYGEAITQLVTIRNTHGRGNYADRTPVGSEKELLIYERENSALVMLNNRLDSGFDARNVQTSFAPGTPLVELTGTADDPVVDPADNLANFVIVNANGTVDIRVPRNVTGTTEHGKGYLIYGVSGPQGTMRLTDSSGSDLTDVIEGEVPNATTFGTARLNELTVVSEDSFNVRLETTPVTIGGVRDQHADGDEAFLKIDSGIDINGNGSVEHVTPNSIAYGFEDFQDIHQPGYFETDGLGTFQQAVDASQLSEGVHFITSRAYRHRNTATGGDGGPEVYTDFRTAIYVDRLPPESAVFSFEPYESQPNVLDARDLIVRSMDQTADSVHVFLNLPAALDDQSVLAMVNSGNQAEQVDRDLFIYGFDPVRSGNNVLTIVTYEPTGNVNVQRVPATQLQTMLNMQTGNGAGIGDLNFDDQLLSNDLLASSLGFEALVYSQNTKFNPGADANGDGYIDTRDMLDLGAFLVDGGAAQSTLDDYCDMVYRRGDIDQNGISEAADIAALRALFGTDDWFSDLNVDGTTDEIDLDILISTIFGSLPGDANLDGLVDGTDFQIWNANKFQTGTGWGTADFNFDGVADGRDLLIWNQHKFESGVSCSDRLTMSNVPSVPEPAGWLLLSLALPFWRRLACRHAAG